MTDRLAELRGTGGSMISDDGGDIEAGLDAGDQRDLEKYRRECEAITKTMTWAEKKVKSVSDSQRRGGSVVSEEETLEQVETRVSAVRKRLKRMAEENKEFRRNNPGRNAVIRTRVVQHTRLAKVFMEVVGELERVKEVRRGGLKQGLVDRVVGVVGQDVGEEEVGRAIEDGRVDMLVEERGGVQARYQLEDVRERNKEIEKVGKKMQELHQMFVDMSIIVDGQEDLLNQIDHNVQEVAPAVKGATTQLEVARNLQKKKRKKIICLICCLVVLVAVIVGIILIVMRNQIFGSGNQNNPTPTPNPTPARLIAQLPLLRTELELFKDR